eukprot:3775087-Rhodomonas_salina.1
MQFWGVGLHLFCSYELRMRAEDIAGGFLWHECQGVVFDYVGFRMHVGLERGVEYYDQLACRGNMLLPFHKL